MNIDIALKNLQTNLNQVQNNSAKLRDAAVEARLIAANMREKILLSSDDGFLDGVEKIIDFMNLIECETGNV